MHGYELFYSLYYTQQSVYGRIIIFPTQRSDQHFPTEEL